MAKGYEVRGEAVRAAQKAYGSYWQEYYEIARGDDRLFYIIPLDEEE